MGTLGTAPVRAEVSASEREPTDVAIVGAGPYGLSLAAHLRRQGVAFRIFGRPMAVWRERMPAGMSLKSEPFASSLYDPDGSYPLSRFCAERGIAYDDVGLPVSLQTFCDYGQAFQERFVPDLDQRLVTAIRRTRDGFTVVLADGEVARFRRVVVAVGISHYDQLPPEWGHLPSRLLSHSANAGDLSRFPGQRVAVIGAGASAVDTAVSLADIGVEVHLVTRRPRLGFHPPPKQRSWLDRVRSPMSAVGPSWKSVLCTRLPLLFYLMPERFRLEVTRRFLGPAPCWFTREPFERNVTLHAQAAVRSIDGDGPVTLDLDTPNGPQRLEADHVIAATGYRVDLRRLGFLDPPLRDAVRQVEHTPILSRGFESSVPGLFFIGVSAANSFGPLLRFACGARCTARRLARRLEQSRSD